MHDWGGGSSSVLGECPSLSGVELELATVSLVLPTGQYGNALTLRDRRVAARRADRCKRLDSNAG
jgi:hypothetical protein